MSLIPTSIFLAAENDKGLSKVSIKKAEYILEDSVTLTLFPTKPIVICEDYRRPSRGSCRYSNLYVSPIGGVWPRTSKQVFGFSIRTYQCVFEWLGFVLRVVIVFDEPSKARNIAACAWCEGLFAQILELTSTFLD